jgi:diguanylate cyclase (GGDEF)-like protein/PAS domain S-box-containing protein
MSLQWIIFASVLIINAVIAVTIAALLSRKRTVPGLTSMRWLLIALAVWAFCYGMITISPTLEAKHFWLKLENIGITTHSAFWFIFTLQFTHLDRFIPRPLLFALGIIPLVSLTLLFSEKWFDLYYTGAHIASPEGGPLIIERGFWYMPQLIQTYLLNGLGTGILFWRFIQVRNIYRRQTVLLLGAVLFPWIANGFYQYTLSNAAPDTVSIDPAPIFFTFTAVLISTAVFGLRLFDLMPIARHTVMEYIPQMVFVVDSYDRLLDANTTAQKWLGKSLDEIIGRDPLDVFRAWPQLINRFFLTERTREEIEIPADPPRTLEIIINPLYNLFDQLEGRVIVAYDITERKQLENKLTHTNVELQKKLDEIEALRAELHEQAIRDPLTGAFNRRFFSEALDQEAARAIRDNSPFSIIILDVDRFKKFNDTYGHKCGDLVLQSLANFLHENTRRGDIVCRYGGEEFVILMPDSDIDAAYQRAETLRSRFDAMSLAYENIYLRATFSAGVASYPSSAKTSEGVLHAADQALYLSKSGGRNRVTIYKS